MHDRTMPDGIGKFSATGNSIVVWHHRLDLAFCPLDGFLIYMGFVIFGGIRIGQ